MNKTTKGTTMTIYGYIRKSTEKQSFQHMELEIEQYAKKNGFKIDEWIEETISSRKALNKRQLGLLLEKLKKVMCSLPVSFHAFLALCRKLFQFCKPVLIKIAKLLQLRKITI